MARRGIFDRIGRTVPEQGERPEAERPAGSAERPTLTIRKVTNNGPATLTAQPGPSGQGNTTGPIHLTPRQEPSRRPQEHQTEADMRIADLEQQLQEAGAENQRLRESLEAATGSAALNDDLRQLDETREALRLEAEEKTRQIEEARAALSSQEAEIAKLQSADARGAARLESLRRLNEKPDPEFSAAVEQIVERYAALRKRAQEAEGDAEQDDRQLKEMGGSEFVDPEGLKALEEKYEALRGELLGLQRELSRLSVNAGRNGDIRTTNLYKDDLPQDEPEQDEEGAENLDGAETETHE